MASSLIGVDIGTRELKLAVVENGKITALEREHIPVDLISNGQITSFDALGEYIGAVCKERKLNVKKCSVLLPDSQCFVRYITTPMMKEQHLRINLPFEFHDFIQDDKDKYYFDFAVLSPKNGESDGNTLELMAAATKKGAYWKLWLCHENGGKKLAVAMPNTIGYSNLIPAVGAENQEYCFIDLGHTSTRINIFQGRRLVATKIIEYGMEMLDNIIAEIKNVDIHIACSYKESNYENVLESEQCINLYNAIAIEVMRAINFYRFNNPESHLEDAYLCGGGAYIKPLAEAIAQNTELTLLSPALLMGNNKLTDAEATGFAGAIGAAMV